MIIRFTRADLLEKYKSQPNHVNMVQNLIAQKRTIPAACRKHPDFPDDEHMMLFKCWATVATFIGQRVASIVAVKIYTMQAY